MATNETVEFESEKSASSSSRPVSSAAVETAAILASETDVVPLRAAASLASLPTPISSSGSQFEVLRHHQEDGQLVNQQHKPPPQSTGAPSVISSKSKLSQCLSQVTSMKPITSMTESKQNIRPNNSSSNSKEMILRAGKWTAEEEHYASILIKIFEEGRFDEFEHHNKNDKNCDEAKQPPKFKITNGMTLRAYLSRKLFCSPMRISKKFAGKGIGKLVYRSQSPKVSNQCGFSRPSLTRLQKMNLLKQAESNFLRVAFPDGDRVKVRKGVLPTLKKATAPFAASHSGRKRSLPVSVNEVRSTSNTPHEIMSTPKVPRIDTSSCGSLQIEAPFIAAENTSLNNKPDTTNSSSALQQNKYSYQSSWDRKQLGQHQHHKHRKKMHYETTGEASSAPSTTGGPSSSKNAMNTAHPPFIPIPNNTLQLQQEQPRNVNIQIMGSQHQSKPTGVVCLENIATAYRLSQIIEDRSAIEQQPSPLMAAPKLVSRNPDLTKTDRAFSVPTIWTTNDNDNKDFRSTPLLQQMQCEQKRQLIQEQNQSQIQVLKEAYCKSVSPNKQRVSKNFKTKDNMIATCSKSPKQLAPNNATMHQERYADEILMPSIDHLIAETESRRITALEHNDDTTIAIEALSNTFNVIGREQSPSNRAISSSSNWDQMMDESPRSEIDVPNFLSGFDKISQHRLSIPFDQSAQNNTACDVQQSARYSPAYHTSKSFDDFHRYLGKNLSPTVSFPPKFSNLRTTTAGPVIPSIESSDEASASNLQMRSRNQHNLASTLRNNATPRSKPCAPIVEHRSVENILSEAYAEAVRSSHDQQLPQKSQTQCQTSADKYNMFSKKPDLILTQYSASALEEKAQERPCQSDQNQQHKSDGASEFPLDGMMFEDFGTLASY